MHQTWQFRLVLKTKTVALMKIASCKPIMYVALFKTRVIWALDLCLENQRICLLLLPCFCIWANLRISLSNHTYEDLAPGYSYITFYLCISWCLLLQMTTGNIDWRPVMQFEGQMHITLLYEMKLIATIGPLGKTGHEVKLYI